MGVRGEHGSVFGGRHAMLLGVTPKKICSDFMYGLSF